MQEAGEDYSLVFPVMAGDLRPFVGDLSLGSRVMEGRGPFSANAQLR